MPPQSRYSSPLDVILLNVLSDKSANFVGTVMFAVAFPLWFAVKVATVVPFFWIVIFPFPISEVRAIVPLLASRVVRVEAPALFVRSK